MSVVAVKGSEKRGHRVGRLAALLAAMLALAASGCACTDADTRGQTPRLTTELRLDPSGVADYLLDFGPVLVGERSTAAVQVGNEGSTALILHLDGAIAPFSVDAVSRQATVEVGATAHLGFSFSPTVAARYETIVELATNEGGGRRRHTIRLLGEGIDPALSCSPSLLDFGVVLRGTEPVLQLHCTNPLPTSLEVGLGGVRGNHGQFFSAALIGGSEGRITLPPEGELSIQLRLQASTLGANSATLMLIDAHDQLLAEVPAQAQVVASALAVEPASCLDFGYVGLGERASASLHLRNIGNEELRIVRFLVPPEDEEEFSVAFDQPTILGPMDDPLAVQVDFHPAANGLRTTNIGVVFTDERDQTHSITACVQGIGGGPKLSCAEGPLSFGMVAVGIPVTRSFICVNDGVAPDDGVVDPLQILGVESDHPAFTAAIRNPDGSYGPRPEGYALGETFQVEVTYGPTAEGFDSGEILVAAEGASDGGHRKAVFGEGRDLPPCQFTIIPPRLRFGIVDRGEERTQRFGIRNEQQTSCLINDLRLEEGSDPAFVVEPIESVELFGFETLEVSVTFAPAQYRDLMEGVIRFQVSNPETPVATVPLHGASRKPCLYIDPNPLDFGKAAPGCRSRAATLAASNVCGTPMTITGIEVNDSLGASRFQVGARPIFPHTIPANAQVEFTITYQPEALQQDVGLVAVEAMGPSGEAELYTGQLLGEGSTEGKQTDHFTQRDRPKVDILFVIDNSGSMGPYQDILRNNLPSFLDFAEAQLIDYQIGVTTTGINPVGSSCPGGALGGEDGRLFPVNGSETGRPRILNRETPDLEAAWRYNLNVGTCHGDEVPYEAAYRALSSPLIDSVQDPRHATGWNDGNAGFLRKDAALSIIFVTDERDHSLGSRFGRDVQDYLAFFRGIKGARNQNLFKIHAITGPWASKPVPGCQADEGDRLLIGVEETGGTWMNICTPTGDHEVWASGLKQMSRGAFGFTSRFYLRGVPADVNGDGRLDESDIELLVDGWPTPAEVSKVQIWTYDPMANAIDFTPLHLPAPGAQIAITYELGCGGT